MALPFPDITQATAPTPVNIGLAPNDNLGDPLRTAFTFVNARAAGLESATARAKTNFDSLDARATAVEGRATTLEGGFLYLNWRGAWATATAYVFTPAVRRDYFVGPDGTAYVVLQSHTSTSIAADLTSGVIGDIDSIQLRADLGGTGAGQGASMVQHQRNDLAGAQPSSLAAHIRRSEINLARDFNLSPGADITTALAAAMNDGRKIYIPGTPLGSGNDWLVSAELPLLRFDQVIEGDGLGYTRIRSTVANNHVFRNGALAANRMRLSRMSIEALGTGSPIYFPYAAASFGIVYWSEFNGLLLKAVDGNAMHLGLEFNTTVRSCVAQSDTMHAFFIQGGNTTTVEGCYAIKCGPDKAGYRSGGGGVYISCNGLNLGTGSGSNFWFGGVASDANDSNPTPAIFHAQLINCNMEDFERFGLKLRQEGTCEVIGGKWARNNAGSTYLALADLSGGCKLRVKGNARRDIAGTRASNAGEGISTPYLADFNIASASSTIVWEEASATTLTYTTAGVSPKPIWSKESQNRTVTMGIAGSTTPGANTVSSAVRYRIDGDSCRVWGRLSLTTKDVAMAGNVRLTGLPYSGNGSVTLCGAGNVARFDLITLTGGRTHLAAEVTAATDYVQLFQCGAGLSAVLLTAADIASGAIIDFDVTYLL